MIDLRNLRQVRSLNALLEYLSLLLSYEDEIVEFINNKIHQYVEENKEEIIKKVKQI